jgi:surface antigen
MLAWAILPALLLALPRTADAQISMRMIPSAWAGLTEDDMARLSAAAARLYEGTAIGTVERWRNPDTGNAGSVRLANSFTAKTMPCRALDYTIRFARNTNAPAHYALTWCRIESGEWKIVETGPRGTVQ